MCQVHSNFPCSVLWKWKMAKKKKTFIQVLHLKLMLLLSTNYILFISWFLVFLELKAIKCASRFFLGFFSTRFNTCSAPLCYNTDKYSSASNHPALMYSFWLPRIWASLKCPLFIVVKMENDKQERLTSAGGTGLPYILTQLMLHFWNGTISLLQHQKLMTQLKKKERK